MELNNTKKEVTTEKKETVAPTEGNGENIYLGNAAWIVVICIILLVAIVSYFVKPSTIADAWRSIFSSEEVINVKLSAAAAEANKPITLTYEHKNQKTADEGNYYLSYSCSNGLSLSIQAGKPTSVVCGRPFEITNFASSSLSIIPTLSKGDSASTTIEVSYVENATSTTPEQGRVIKGEATLNIVKTLALAPSTTTPATKGTTVKNTPTTTTTPKPVISGTVKPTGTTPTKSTTERQAGPTTEKFYAIDPATQSALPSPNQTIRTGPIDLAVTVLSIGKVELVTNKFTPTTNLKTGDRVAVQFEIKNTGTAPVTEWAFAVTFPLNPPYTFISEKQQVLTPGDYIIYTIGADKMLAGTNQTITIIADPNNDLPEVTKGNNIGLAQISVQ